MQASRTQALNETGKHSYFGMMCLFVYPAFPQCASWTSTSVSNLLYFKMSFDNAQGTGVNVLCVGGGKNSKAESS